jgi:predicted RNase H-like nuclease
LGSGALKASPAVDRMTRYLGLDGFRRGWVAAWIDDRGGQGFDLLGSLGKLSISPDDKVMVDMPIGLPERGNRSCDLGARAILGSARSRVFTGARRPLLNHASRAEAHSWGKRTDGIGVSCQLFCILPKIREVDSFMTPEKQAVVRETHPELVFLRLNRSKPLVGKKTPAGRSLRRSLLIDAGFDEIDAWLECLPGTGAKPDDLFDACVAAIAAVDPRGRIPAEEPVYDGRGLRMEICY